MLPLFYTEISAKNRGMFLTLCERVSANSRPSLFTIADACRHKATKFSRCGWRTCRPQRCSSIERLRPQRVNTIFFSVQAILACTVYTSLPNSYFRTHFPGAQCSHFVNRHINNKNVWSAKNKRSYKFNNA